MEMFILAMFPLLVISDPLSPNPKQILILSKSIAQSGKDRFDRIDEQEEESANVIISSLKGGRRYWLSSTHKQINVMGYPRSNYFLFFVCFVNSHSCCGLSFMNLCLQHGWTVSPTWWTNSPTRAAGSPTLNTFLLSPGQLRLVSR